jgi:hypothetical protein
MFNRLSTWLWKPRPSDPNVFTCLVNHRLKLVYAYVPKAACSTVKMWLVQEAGFAPDLVAAWSRQPAPQYHANGKVKLVPNMHEYLDRHYSLRHASPREVAAVLADPSYFRFTVVRNPLSRLVSAYLDKIVHAKRPAWGLIARGQKAIGAKPHTQSLLDCLRPRPALDCQRGLTFREFVAQLGRENAAKLDPHFAPQSQLLRGIPLAHVARAENLEADFRDVQERLGCCAPLTNQNTREYAAEALAEGLANLPAESFRELGAAPSWPHFYDAELLAKVAQIYQADFARFGYESELPANSARQEQALLPLSLGEGTGEATSSPARQSPLPAGQPRASRHRSSLRRRTNSASA